MLITYVVGESLEPLDEGWRLSAWALQSESGLDSSSGLYTQLEMAAVITVLRPFLITDILTFWGVPCYLLSLQLSSGWRPQSMLVDFGDNSVLFTYYL